MAAAALAASLCELRRPGFWPRNRMRLRLGNRRGGGCELVESFAFMKHMPLTETYLYTIGVCNSVRSGTPVVG